MEQYLLYVWHDCFVYHGDSCVIVFDYWQNPPATFPNPHVKLETILQEIFKVRGKDFPLYFLVSHHHKDHFNREIFSFAKAYRNVRYILSKDTAKSVNYIIKEDSTYSGRLKVSPSQIITLKPGDSFESEFIKVQAFGSTDIGNSYMVEVDCKTIFHAGDLNAWVWKDESTAEEINTAIGDFERILSTIKEKYPKIDYAMFPVDARIGRDFWEGAWLFVRQIDVKYFIPMHFCLYLSDKQRMDFESLATSSARYANIGRGYYCAMRAPGEKLLMYKF